MRKGLPTFCHALLLVVLMQVRTEVLVAQQTERYHEPIEKYIRAVELYDHEKYASAQALFRQVATEGEIDNEEVVANATYYRALCGLRLFNANAEDLLIDFIQTFPQSPKVNRAYFDLGEYQYRKRRYKQAIGWFEKVNVYVLNNEELAEYYFKLGYSYFKEEMTKEALQALFEIKDAETPYSVVAKYYYAHLSYASGNMETALKYFREIESTETFGPIIPYYIAQILYNQKKYEEVVSYAGPLVDSVNTQKAHEISRLIGESYYKLKKYKESLPYLIAFVEYGGEIIPEDYYEIGFAHFQVKSYKDAVHWFQQALSDNDSLNQIIQYNMAEAYLELEMKLPARNALRLASTIGEDQDIKETALYDYAKLAYELAQYPYNDAVRAFEEYINTFPKSKRLEEANEYLVGVYFTTRNYEEARKSLDRIQNRGLKLNLAYQKILYYLGVENMNKGQYQQAVAYFDLSIQENYDRSVAISALFWKAEALFRLVDYSASAETYEKFLSSAGSRNSGLHYLALYNTGYAYYRKRDYPTAIFRFRQFLAENDSTNSRLRNDATLRVADSYFITREYKPAVEYYDKANKMGMLEKDYALFQSALASGVMTQYDQKIEKLKRLTTEFKESVYLDDALFELGDVLFIQNQPGEALKHFERLLAEIPESPYFSRTLLKTGLIHYNRKDDTLALARFQQVVRDYRNTTESKEALDKIKKIYIDRGDLAAFEEYMSGVGFENLSITSLDSAAYEIAENAYLNNNCNDAVKNFTLYIDKYPSGLFLINAHYYRGDCELRSGFKQEALIDFEYVLEQPRNKFSEKALSYAAVISREVKDYDRALKYYNRLLKTGDNQANIDQAHYWLMKIHKEREEYAEALKFAEIILKKEGLRTEVKSEVNLLSGKIYLRSDRYNKAYNAFQNLLHVNNEEGAEGKYQLAYIEYMRGNLDSSEHFIDVLFNQVPAYDYWIAKAFILWSDIYLARDDRYQAKVSLQSVIENYEGNDLKNIAAEKLRLIEEQEKQEKSANEKIEKAMEIRFNSDENYDDLFEEEVFEEEIIEKNPVEEPMQNMEVPEEVKEGVKEDNNANEEQENEENGDE